MVVIGLDLGGTKLSGAIFDQKGNIISKATIYLANRQGKEVGEIIKKQIRKLFISARKNNFQVTAIGISVPGISYQKTGKVWAPNIPGWDDYPLYNEIFSEINNRSIKICIDNDRVCSIMGELWMGKAKGCKDIIFLVVGTGIGAGILVNGKIVRGYSGAAGAVGWLALDRPFLSKYASCGCFEYYASGDGIAKAAREFVAEDDSYKGVLRTKQLEEISSFDVFAAYERGDAVARKVLAHAIEFWGMTVANLVSLFNPEKIILGGGIFGPALKFRNEILHESRKWAQPLSISQVCLEGSALGSDTALYGAGYLALKNIE